MCNKNNIIKKMKKQILILGIVTSVFAFTSCGNNSSDENVSVDTTAVDVTVDSLPVVVDSATTDSVAVVDSASAN